MDILTGGIVFYSAWIIYEWIFGEKNDDMNNIKEVWQQLFSEYSIQEFKKTETGYLLIIEIPLGGSINSIENKKSILEKALRSQILIKDIRYSNICEVELINKVFRDLPFKPVPLKPTELLSGHNHKGEPLIIDMLETPHLLITGLSGNGKTGMIRVMIKNLLANGGVDTMLLNGFINDYKGFNISHITDHKDIETYIQELLNDINNGITRDRPLYIFFDELGKVKDKNLIGLITKLLQYGRHNKIYLIGIIQTATKEELKFKSLFNARCTFKQLEESSYRVVLGCSIDGKLQKREFYLYTNDLYKGYTYTLQF